MQRLLGLGIALLSACQANPQAGFETSTDGAQLYQVLQNTTRRSDFPAAIGRLQKNNLAFYRQVLAASLTDASFVFAERQFRDVKKAFASSGLVTTEAELAISEVLERFSLNPGVVSLSDVELFVTDATATLLDVTQRATSHRLRSHPNAEEQARVLNVSLVLTLASALSARSPQSLALDGPVYVTDENQAPGANVNYAATVNPGAAPPNVPSPAPSPPPTSPPNCDKVNPFSADFTANCLGGSNPRPPSPAIPVSSTDGANACKNAVHTTPAGCDSNGCCWSTPHHI